MDGLGEQIHRDGSHWSEGGALNPVGRSSAKAGKQTRTFFFNSVCLPYLRYCSTSVKLQ